MVSEPKGDMRCRSRGGDRRDTDIDNMLKIRERPYIETDLVV